MISQAAEPGLFLLPLPHPRVLNSLPCSGPASTGSMNKYISSKITSSLEAIGISCPENNYAMKSRVRSISSLVGLGLQAEARLHSSNTAKALLDSRATSTQVPEGKPRYAPRHWDLILHIHPRCGLDAAMMLWSLLELAHGLLCAACLQEYRDPEILNTYLYILFWCQRQMDD